MNFQASAPRVNVRQQRMNGICASSDAKVELVVREVARSQFMNGGTELRAGGKYECKGSGASGRKNMFVYFSGTVHLHHLGTQCKSL